jgi:uncharacterized phiE125 gp8 family phage protein
MIAPTLITPPAPLLSVPEVKAHLRIDSSHEDAMLEGLIAAAQAWLDGWQGVLGRCILTQTWASRCADLVDQRLPFPDVVSAVVTYLDTAGATQTVAPLSYRLRTESGQGQLIFADGYSAPQVMAGRDDAVTITAVYGRADVPPAIRTAALMLVAHWHRNSEAVVTGTITATVPIGVDALIAPWRVVAVG